MRNEATEAGIQAFPTSVAKGFTVDDALGSKHPSFLECIPRSWHAVQYLGEAWLGDEPLGHADQVLLLNRFPMSFSTIDDQGPLNRHWKSFALRFQKRLSEWIASFEGVEASGATAIRTGERIARWIVTYHWANVTGSLTVWIMPTMKSKRAVGSAMLIAHLVESPLVSDGNTID